MKIKQDTKSVYVILNTENKRVKLGYSEDPVKRCQNLLTQSGCNMRLIYHTKPIYNYAEVEKDIHCLFSDKRLIGEWFNIDSKVAQVRLRSLVVNSKVCIIVSHFERGHNATYIADKMGVSRTGVIKYLNSKGYMLKEYQKKKKLKKRTKYADIYKERNKPTNVDNGIHLSSDRLEEMVRVNNEKRANRTRVC